LGRLFHTCNISKTFGCSFGERGFSGLFSPKPIDTAGRHYGRAVLRTDVIWEKEWKLFVESLAVAAGAGSGQEMNFPAFVTGLSPA